MGGVGGWGGGAGEGVAATPPQAGAAGTWSGQPRDRQGQGQNPMLFYIRFFKILLEKNVLE